MEQQLAKPNDQRVVLADDLQAQIDEIRKQDKGMAYDPLTIKASLQKDRFWFKRRGSDEPLEKRDSLVTHVFFAHKTRAAYGGRDQKVPSCVSLDGCRTGTLNPRFASTLPIPIPNGQPCTTCPFNAFGTGVDQQGNPTNSKFCGERRLLLAFVEGYDDPIVISVPTMSTGPWDAYADGLEKVQRTSFVTQGTLITIDNVQRGDQGDYGRAHFATMGTLPNEQIIRGIEARKQFSSMLGTVMEQQSQDLPTDEAEEVPTANPADPF